MTSAQEIADNQVEAENSTLTWNGASYPCTVGMQNRDSRPGDSGEIAVWDSLRAWVRVAVLGVAVMRAREMVSVEGRTYRVEGISRPPGGLVLILDMTHAP